MNAQRAPKRGSQRPKSGCQRDDYDLRRAPHCLNAGASLSQGSRSPARRLERQIQRELEGSPVVQGIRNLSEIRFVQAESRLRELGVVQQI